MIKHSFFWNYETKQIASRTWYWFPNTCIHKSEHAFSEYGGFSKGNFKKFHKKVLLIENDHSQLHKYYSNKIVVFSKNHRPIYLRSITNTSITANRSIEYGSYINSFGNWKNNKLIDYTFLGKKRGYVYQTIIAKLRNIKAELSFRKNYKNQVGLK